MERYLGIFKDIGYLIGYLRNTYLAESDKVFLAQNLLDEI